MRPTCSPSPTYDTLQFSTCYKTFKPIPYISGVDMDSGTTLFPLCLPLSSSLFPLFPFILLDKMQGLSCHYGAFAAIKAGNQLEA